MTTRRKPDGYAARQELVRIRNSHADMVSIARRMAQEQINSRLAFLLGKLALELAEQGLAIGELERIHN